MGFQILLFCFAVVTVGGMGSLQGTFLAPSALGMMISLTGRFWVPAATQISGVPSPISSKTSFHPITPGWSLAGSYFLQIVDEGSGPTLVNCSVYF